MRNFRVICMKKSNETSSPLTTQLFWLNIYLATFWGGRVLVVENSFLFYKKTFAKSSRQGWPPLENCAVVKWSVTSPLGPSPRKTQENAGILDELLTGKMPMILPPPTSIGETPKGSGFVSVPNNLFTLGCWGKHAFSTKPISLDKASTEVMPNSCQILFVLP